MTTAPLSTFTCFAIIVLVVTGSFAATSDHAAGKSLKSRTTGKTHFLVISADMAGAGPLNKRSGEAQEATTGTPTNDQNEHGDFGSYLSAQDTSLYSLWSSYENIKRTALPDFPSKEPNAFETNILPREAISDPSQSVPQSSQPPSPSSTLIPRSINLDFIKAFGALNKQTKTAPPPPTVTATVVQPVVVSSAIVYKNPDGSDDVFGEGPENHKRNEV